MPKHTYKIRNLGCANCAAKMADKIRKLPGVEDADITFATATLHLEAEAPARLLPEIQGILSSIEPDAELEIPGQHSQHNHHHDHCCDHDHHHEDHCCGHDHCCDHDHHHEPHQHSHAEEESSRPLWLGSGLFLLGLALDFLKLTVLGLPVSLVPFVASYLILGLPVLKNAGKTLLRGHFLDENFLMSIATLGAFAIQEFPEAVGIMLFYRVGEYFEHRAVERSRSQIMEAVDLRVQTVTLAGGQQIPAEEVRPGQQILVRPGDRVPLDGVVLEGESRLDTAPITGEPVPVNVKPGDSILSGCINTEGLLTVRVEKPLSESMVTRILNAVENAAAGKPKLDRFITRFARIYTPAVVAAAILTAVVPSLLTGRWDYWIYTALSFLVMSCPCALVLSVPLAFFSGIGAGSKQGILFKGGLSMEAMARIRVVAMDKTGTLTKGEFKVQKFEGRQDLLSLCAACEENSTHPIARSILAAAKEQNLSWNTPEQMEEYSGEGVRAVLEGHAVLCGNRRLLQRFSVAVPEIPMPDGTLVLVAVDEEFAGWLLIADGLKDDSPEAVKNLHHMGIQTALLTGDREETAQLVAKETGIRRVFSRLLPEEKLTALQSLRQEYGPAMFVGDGINDAPVLAGADVGAAMGSGADAAIEAADVVYLNARAEAIPRSLRIARRTRNIAWQNVVFALTVKGIVMILGLLGFASMWMAVFADSGVAMLCVLNSIRLLYEKQEGYRD